MAELAAHEELASLEQLVDQFGVCAETGPALADGLESLGRRFDKLTAEEQARFDVLFERVGARLRSNIDAQAIDLHHGEFK